MERKVFKIHLDCSKCSLPLTIVTIGGNSLGELFVDGLCVLCAREVRMQVDMRIVSERAARTDAQFDMSCSYIN